jgi:DNA polymerase-3 subunit epsilon
MILFFDTETTGFVDDRMPPGHECQPHIVQLAALLTDSDGKEYAAFNSVVQVPADVMVPAAASGVHGITTHISHTFGIYPTAANYMWDRMAQMAHTIVAHNIKFDRAVMETAFMRRPPVNSKAGIPTDLNSRHADKAWVCTMEMASPILNLPPTDRMKAAGFDKPKPPKLEECVKYFFGEDLDGAHDALVDVRACARIFFHMINQKAVE